VKIEAPRGTLDVLPADQPRRLRILEATATAAEDYGYGLIVAPTFEDTELFARTSGQGSDVVQKEMYTFEDKSGRSLTLRPEGTAQVARAYVEHGLHREPQPLKTYYAGPMFRYSAPQKGRYREFWQIGFEAMGSDDPAVDAEVIQAFVEIERRAGVRHTSLELNSIGDRECRPAYVERLRAFLDERRDDLDDDTRRRAEVSPAQGLRHEERGRPPRVGRGADDRRVALRAVPGALRGGHGLPRRVRRRLRARPDARSRARLQPAHRVRVR
jgi:histidyl-tRNA synthetase